MAASAGPEIERLIGLLAKLPGLGPRSARRAALALLKRRDQLLEPLSAALLEAKAKVRACGVCGALDSRDPCQVCSDPERDRTLICVVEEVGAAQCPIRRSFQPFVIAPPAMQTEHNHWMTQ